jgi:hypothetical protein
VEASCQKPTALSCSKRGWLQKADGAMALNDRLTLTVNDAACFLSLPPQGYREPPGLRLRVHSAQTQRQGPQHETSLVCISAHFSFDI